MYKPKAHHKAFHLQITALVEEVFNRDFCQYREQISVWIFSHVEVYFLEVMNASASLPLKSFLLHTSSMVGLKSSHGHPLLPALKAAGQCREGAPLPLTTNGREKERFLELHPRQSNPPGVPGRASTAVEMSAFKEQK